MVPLLSNSRTAIQDFHVEFSLAIQRIYGTLYQAFNSGSSRKLSIIQNAPMFKCDNFKKVTVVPIIKLVLYY